MIALKGSEEYDEGKDNLSIVKNSHDHEDGLPHKTSGARLNRKSENDPSLRPFFSQGSALPRLKA